MSENAPETVTGLIEYGGSLIHAAIGFRRIGCGTDVLRSNLVPIGAFRLDDPHFCARCRELANASSGRDAS